MTYFLIQISKIEISKSMANVRKDYMKKNCFTLISFANKIYWPNYVNYRYIELAIV